MRCQGRGRVGYCEMCLLGMKINRMYVGVAPPDELGIAVERYTHLLRELILVLHATSNYGQQS